MRFLTMRLLTAMLSVIYVSQAQGADTPFKIVIDARETVIVNSNIVINIKLKNVLKNSIEILKVVGDNDQAQHNYTILVWNENDEIVPCKKYKGLRLSIVSGMLIELKSGEELQEGANLSDIYEMANVGKYRVQVQRDIPEKIGSGVVKSNEIEINVIDSNGNAGSGHTASSRKSH